MLTEETRRQIEAEATRHLGTPYTRDFNCMTFVRTMYRAVELTLPPVAANVRFMELADPPIGHILYLRHKESSVRRSYTHAAIILPGRRCIHCSYYFGGKVVVSELDELLKTYDVAGIER
ncbi:MAG: hypothetical protein Q7S84_00760 [bacterium]|nr:hypothetical protein [bacterium]